MKILDMEQTSPEWFEARAGLPTSSQFDKLLTMTGKPSKQAEKYAYTLAGEKLLGRKEEGYSSYHMERGLEMEDEARTYYELIKGAEVQQVGFCVSDDGKWGCSPDGLIGEDGGLEIKCPKMSTHIAYMLSGGKDLVKDYRQQLQGCLLTTARAWWDIMSYYPGLEPVIVRVEPDKAYHVKLQAQINKVVAAAVNVYETLKNYRA